MTKIKWYLKITRTDNGYLLQGNDNFEEVIQDGEEDELKSHYDLLWTIMDYFNFGGNKHDEERIRVTREKQDE